ncbi:hypothetical protein [Filimonas lacunae]|uniref:hypothetical protein n=1 Tax=Filimonas lacunae TaxID=477680 RepID=UPI0007D7176E|nr:hypothetical protein [Filimonas lacunae]BAV07185.1 hypothetical protein FLA_3208 [Filimonas lacunae]
MCVLIRFKDLLPGNDTKGFVIIMGWVLAPFMNLVVNVWTGGLLIGKKAVPIPKWLRLVNFIFLLLQIIFLPLK